MTWTNQGDVGTNPINRYFAQAMDRLVGPDFETGLKNLKALAERSSTQRPAAGQQRATAAVRRTMLLESSEFAPMARVQPTETELKLQLAPKHIGWFRRSPALSKAACTDVAIDNVYFDTADRLLQRHQMALRVRQIGSAGCRR